MSAYPENGDIILNRSEKTKSETGRPLKSPVRIARPHKKFKGRKVDTFAAQNAAQY